MDRRSAISSTGIALKEARWTHVALPTGNLDRAIAFYTELTPLVVVERFKDAVGESAWPSNAQQAEAPFVLVLVSFDKDTERELGVLTPFAHIGIEVPQRSDVDALAEKAREMGVLHWEPQYVSETVGYVCALHDPDGNVIETSHNQKVFETVRRLWGASPDSAQSSPNAM
jgi:lactoylglutathione lyase